MAEEEKSLLDRMQDFLNYDMSGNTLQAGNVPVFDRPEPIEDPTIGQTIRQAVNTLPSIAKDVATGAVEMGKQVYEDPTLIADAAKTVGNIVWNPNDVPFIAAIKSRLLRKTGSNDHVFNSAGENTVDEIEKPWDDYIASVKERYGKNWKENVANNPEAFLMDGANLAGLTSATRLALLKLVPNKEAVLNIIDTVRPQPNLVPAVATAGGKSTSAGQQTENLMPTTRAMFGGANANAPITKGPFSQAEKMSAKGAQPQDTWKETGWWLDDADGKWRFEIDDSQASLPEAMMKTNADGEFLINSDAAYNDNWSNPDSLEFDQNGPKPLAYDEEFQGEFYGPGSSVWKLGDLLKHDKLFKNYPELKNKTVILNAQLETDTLGSYNPDTGVHKISSAVSDPEEIRSVLLHEIQHAIQQREGMGPGTNVSSASTFNTNKLLKRRQEVYDSLIDYNVQMPELKFSTNTNFNVEFEAALKNQNLNLPVKIKQDAIKKFKKINDELYYFLREENNASKEFYFNENGEIEARLTQDRERMDQSEREFLSPIVQKINTIQDSPIAKKRFSWPYSASTAQSNFELNPTYARMDKELVTRPNVTDIILKVDPEYDINAFGTNRGGWIYEGKKFQDYEEVLDLNIRKFLSRTKDTKKVSAIKPGDVFKDQDGKEFVFRSFRKVTVDPLELNPIQPQIILDSVDTTLDLNKGPLDIVGANVIRLDSFTKAQRLDAIKFASKGSMYDDVPDTIGTDNNSIVTLGSMVFDSSLSKLKPNQTSSLRQPTKKEPVNFLARTKNKLGFAEGGSVNNMTRQMKMFEEGGIADDGMNRDPISGNEIPSGSLAKEVRDDIPAQLSEGEYVVPADVVRFFGVKYFEDLRMEAKMGLQKMEQDGRIGGEPMAQPMSSPVGDSSQVTDSDLAQLEQMLSTGVADGGLMDKMAMAAKNDRVINERMNANGMSVGFAEGGMTTDASASYADPTKVDAIISKVMAAVQQEPELLEELSKRGIKVSRTTPQMNAGAMQKANSPAQTTNLSTNTEESQSTRNAPPVMPKPQQQPIQPIKASAGLLTLPGIQSNQSLDLNQSDESFATSSTPGIPSWSPILGGSYINASATGYQPIETEDTGTGGTGGVAPAITSTAESCAAIGMAFDPVTNTCSLAPINNDNDSGPIIPEPVEFKFEKPEVDYFSMTPEELADVSAGKINAFTKKAIQGAGLLAGGTALGAIALGSSLYNTYTEGTAISDMMTRQMVAEARGLTSEAAAIGKELGKAIEGSNFAIQGLVKIGLINGQDNFAQQIAEYSDENFKLDEKNYKKDSAALKRAQEAVALAAKRIADAKAAAAASTSSGGGSGSGSGGNNTNPNYDGSQNVNAAGTVITTAGGQQIVTPTTGNTGGASAGGGGGGYDYVPPSIKKDDDDQGIGGYGGGGPRATGGLIARPKKKKKK